MIAATDSSIRRIALLGFAIQINTPVNMDEEDDQREQGEGLAVPLPVP